MAKYLMFLSLFLGFVAHAEKQPFERYQPIIDRQMFGQPPPGFDPTKMASEVTKQSEKELTKEQEQIRSSVHFSIINVTPSGKTAVGFTDNSDPKTPVHYYLKVGESSGGWTLKEADALKAWMKIEKNGVEVELTLGQNSGKGGGTTSKVASSASASVPNKTTASATSLRTPRSGLLARKSNDGSNALQSFAQRKAEREAKRLEEEKRREEEKAQQEAEREEMRQSLADMKEQLAEQRRLREETAEKAKAESEAKAKAKKQGEDEAQNEGDGEGEESEEGEE